jgi:rhomboid protease GluP
MTLPKLPLATAVLVALNVLVWLLQVASGVAPLHPPAATLIAWGGNVPVLTLTGDTWRLLTSMFLHGGAMHLALNMLALAFTATRLEDEYGTARMLVIYVVGGLLASCSTILWNEWRAAHGDVVGLVTVSVGASGAIMAQFGALLTALVMVPPRFASLPPARRPGVDTGLIQVVVINIALGFVVPHVDQAAHVGGLVAGMVLGAVMAAVPSATGARAALARYGATALLATVCVSALLHGAPHDKLVALRAQWGWVQASGR